MLVLAFFAVLAIWMPTHFSVMHRDISAKQAWNQCAFITPEEALRQADWLARHPVGLPHASKSASPGVVSWFPDLPVLGPHNLMFEALPGGDTGVLVWDKPLQWSGKPSRLKSVGIFSLADRRSIWTLEELQVQEALAPLYRDANLGDAWNFDGLALLRAMGNLLRLPPEAIRAGLARGSDRVDENPDLAAGLGWRDAVVVHFSRFAFSTAGRGYSYLLPWFVEEDPLGEHFKRRNPDLFQGGMLRNSSRISLVWKSLPWQVQPQASLAMDDAPGVAEVDGFPGRMIWSEIFVGPIQFHRALDVPTDDPLLAADALLGLSFWQDMGQAGNSDAFLGFEAAVHAQLRRQALRLAGCDEATLNRYVPARGIWRTTAERVDADARWRTLVALRRENPARWNVESECFEGGAAVPP